MPSYTALAAASLALLQAATASPTPVNDLEKRKAFTVNQVEAKKVLRVGALSMAKTYRKFGAQPPTDVAAAAAAVQSGSVPTTPGDQYDSLYLTQVKAGCGNLMLDFDTGSADLWAFSSLQSTSQTSGHDIYNPSGCNTSKKLSGQSWKISYGDGSGASGQVYADTVVVGPVTATSQAVEAATSVSAQFAEDKDDDGLLGLAFSSINTVSPTKQKTFFDTVKPSLAAPLFSVNLKYHAAGTYDFGYIDSSKYKGDITYVNVDSSQGFWEFTASGYAVGTGATTTASIDVIADTGTTLVYLPTNVVSAYYAKVSGAKYDSQQGGYTFACSTTLPDFSIVIGGKKQTIPGKYINYAPTTGSTCFGGIQRNTGIGLSILGDIFLKSKYVVHEAKDGATPRIGFAEQA